MNRHVCKVHRGYLEHITCTLCIRLGDKGSMKIYESLVVEEFMNGECHGVTDAEHSPEGIGPEPHVGYCPQILKGSVFLLKREAHWVTFSKNLYLLCLYFNGLSAADGFSKRSSNLQACPSGDFLYGFFVDNVTSGDYLDVLYCRTIVKGYELNLFVASFCPYPAFCHDLLPGSAAKQEVLNLSSLQSVHFVRNYSDSIYYIIMQIE